MGQAWGICPVCGAVISLDPVDVPGEPVELTAHLRTHREAASAPSATGPKGETEAAAPSEAPRPLASFPPHPPRRQPPPRPHGRGRSRDEST